MSKITFKTADHKQKAKYIPYICGGLQATFISSVIFNPIMWPIATYYVFNFSKMQELKSNTILEKINKDSREGKGACEVKKEKESEFQERKKKSRNLLIFSSYIMASWNLAANFLLVYCISHYLIKLGNKKSLFIAAGVVGFVSLLNVIRIVAGCIIQVIEKQSIRLQKAALQKNEPRRIDHGLLLSLQLATLSSGIFFPLFYLLGCLPTLMFNKNKPYIEEDKEGNLYIRVVDCKVSQVEGELQLTKGSDYESVMRNGYEYLKFSKDKWKDITAEENKRKKESQTESLKGQGVASNLPVILANGVVLHVTLQQLESNNSSK